MLSDNVMYGCVSYLMHCITTPSPTPSVLNILNMLGNSHKTTVSSSTSYSRREYSLVCPMVETTLCGVWISVCLLTSIKAWANYGTPQKADWTPDYSHPPPCKKNFSGNRACNYKCQVLHWSLFTIGLWKFSNLSS